jgi:bifunctional non-homologous end joining protein LigD
VSAASSGLAVSGLGHLGVRVDGRNPIKPTLRWPVASAWADHPAKAVGRGEGTGHIAARSGQDVRMKPMLATLAERVPTGPEWVHEVKWDGMRVLADVRAGRVTLYARSGNDVTASYPELGGLGEDYDDMLLDGEVVALDGGRPSFAALADRMHVKDSRKAARLATVRPVTFMVFDLLRLFGQDVTGQPWTARRALLEKLDLDSRHWQVPPVFDDGAQLLAATADQGLEGIVSKRRTATYAAGRRSPDWRKKAHRTSLSVVVGGWRPETGSTSRLGSVLVGIPDGDGGWRYAGRVGSGLVGGAGKRLSEILEPLRASASPFADEVPREDSVGTTWVRPRIVVEVKSLGWGGGAGGSRLRQPAYLGVRADLTPEDLQETSDG